MKVLITERQFRYIKETLESTEEVNISEDCRKKASLALIQAKTFWKNWLNKSETKSKFKKNWGKDVEGKVDSIFNSYRNMIDKIVLTFYDNSILKKTYRNVTIDTSKKQDAVAFVHYGMPDVIFVNCSENLTQLYETMVHEIQHSLDMVHHLNPPSKIGKIFNYNQTINPIPNEVDEFWDKITENNPLLSSEEIKKIEQVNSELGGSIFLNYKYALTILLKATKLPYYKNNYEYICDANEKMSNIMSVRASLGLDKNLFSSDIPISIFLNVLKQTSVDSFIKETDKIADLGFILLCWAFQGFPNLQNFVNEINSLAKQYYKQETQTA